MEFHYNGHTFQLYPKVTKGWTQEEKAYAFQVNVSILQGMTSVAAPDRLKVLATQLNLRELFDLDIKQLTTYAHDHLWDPIRKPSVIGYFDAKGCMVENAIDPHTDLLRPADTFVGDVDERRPSGIVYAQLLQQLSFVDFKSSIANTHEIIFYVKLPTTRSPVIFHDPDGIEPSYSLRGFVGASTWADEDFIHGPSFLNGNQNMTPFLLTKGRGTDQSMIDRVGLIAAISNLAHEAGEEWIKKQIFADLCPGYVMNPDIVVRKLSQRGASSDGSSSFLKSVEDYYKEVQQILPSLGVNGQGNYTVNVALSWYQNLDPQIRFKIEEDGTRLYLTSLDCNPMAQRDYLRQMSNAALSAEATLSNMVQLITQHSTKSSFAVNASFSSPASGFVHASTAKRALKRAKEIACWGCNSSDHVWYDSKLKAYLCPRKSDLSCIERAEKMRASFKARRAEKKAQLKEAKANSTPASSSTVKRGSDSTDIVSPPGKFPKNFTISEETMTQFATIVAKSLKGEMKKEKEEGVLTNAYVILLSIPQAYGEKKPLPISIMTTLPHFRLPLGKAGGRRDPMSIWCMYDTGSALNVGYLPFHKFIMEKFPENVKATYSAHTGEYNAIILSGIVSGRKEKNDSTVSKEELEEYQTSLPLVVEYYLPFHHRFGVHEAREELTIRIALGNGTSVNTIIGLSTMKAAKLNFCVIDDVVTSKHWEIEPMPVTYMNTMLGKPAISAPGNMVNVHVRKRHWYHDDEYSSDDEENKRIVTVENQIVPCHFHDNVPISLSQLQAEVGKWSSLNNSY